MTDPVRIESAIGSAVFSPDGRHRYRLDREWFKPYEREPKTCLWVMLNPSLAGWVESDPTVRKCEGFCQRWGFDGMVVVNLFTLVTPYPAELARVEDAERNGPAADAYIGEAAGEAERVVCAWGIPPRMQHARRREGHVRRLLERRYDGQLKCLGRTKKGHPRHPGRIAYASQLEDFGR